MVSTMTQTQIKTSRPWYRYPLVWMMLAIPFSAVIMGAVMLTLALDTDDGLVADDYYKQGLGINEVISRDKKSAELGITAIVDLDNNTRTLRVQFEKGLLAMYPQQIQMQLQHATRANSDISLVLEHGIGNQYIGHIKQPLSQGVWYFEIADSDWKLTARVDVAEKNTIRLQSKY